MALRMSRRFLRNLRRKKHSPRAAVIANLVQFARRESGIGDDRPRVDPARRQQQGGKRDAVFADDDHTIARPDTGCIETSRNVRDPAIQVPTSPGGATFYHLRVAWRKRHETRYNPR